MKLSDSGLRQLETDWMLRLVPERNDRLLVTLVADLRQARERLAANSQNSSRPPRSDAPWSSTPTTATANSAPQEPTSGATENKDQSDDAKAPPESFSEYGLASRTGWMMSDGYTGKWV